MPKLSPEFARLPRFPGAPRRGFPSPEDFANDPLLGLTPEEVEAEQRRTIIKGAGLRTIPEVIGGLGGTVVGGALGSAAGPAGTAAGALKGGMAGGAAGAALGEWLAQRMEKGAGFRDDTNLGSVAVAGALGAVPIGAKPGVSLVRQLPGVAAKTAALSAVGQTGTTLTEEGRLPTAGEVGLAAGAGAVMGGGLHAGLVGAGRAYGRLTSMPNFSLSGRDLGMSGGGPRPPGAEGPPPPPVVPGTSAPPMRATVAPEPAFDPNAVVPPPPVPAAGDLDATGRLLRFFRGAQAQPQPPPPDPRLGRVRPLINIAEGEFAQPPVPVPPILDPVTLRARLFQREAGVAEAPAPPAVTPPAPAAPVPGAAVAGVLRGGQPAASGPFQSYDDLYRYWAERDQLVQDLERVPPAAHDAIVRIANAKGVDLAHGAARRAYFIRPEGLLEQEGLAALDLQMPVYPTPETVEVPPPSPPRRPYAAPELRTLGGPPESSDAAGFGAPPPVIPDATMPWAGQPRPEPLGPLSPLDPAYNPLDLTATLPPEPPPAPPPIVTADQTPAPGRPLGNLLLQRATQALDEAQQRRAAQEVSAQARGTGFAQRMGGTSPGLWQRLKGAVRGEPPPEPPVAPAGPVPGRPRVPARRTVRATGEEPGLEGNLVLDPKTGEGYADAEALFLSPDEYQIKASDRKGNTGKLNAATRWAGPEPGRPPQNAAEVAGSVSPVLVHQRADGTFRVIDGHQRVNLARRLKAAGQPVPKIKVQVVSEANGIDVEMARRMGSIMNMQQGTVDPVDIAKILRAGGLTDVERSVISLDDVSKRKMYLGEGASKLHGDAFQQVIDGRLPIEQGGEIGHRIADPADHLKMAALLRGRKFKTLAHMTEFIEHVKREGFVHGRAAEATQGGLWEQPKETVVAGWAEQADIVAKIKADIAADARYFPRILAERDRGVGKGVEVDEALAAQYGEKAKLLAQHADTFLTRRGFRANTEVRKYGYLNADQVAAGGPPVDWRTINTQVRQALIADLDDLLNNRGPFAGHAGGVAAGAGAAGEVRGDAASGLPPARPTTSTRDLTNEQRNFIGQDIWKEDSEPGLEFSRSTRRRPGTEERSGPLPGEQRLPGFEGQQGGALPSLADVPTDAPFTLTAPRAPRPRQGSLLAEQGREAQARAREERLARAPEAEWDDEALAAVEAEGDFQKEIARQRFSIGEHERLVREEPNGPQARRDYWRKALADRGFNPDEKNPNHIPWNVRQFLRQQLGYHPNEVDLMEPEMALRLGDQQMRAAEWRATMARRARRRLGGDISRSVLARNPDGTLSVRSAIADEEKLKGLLATALYHGARPTIAAKEALQNAFTAVNRRFGGVGQGGTVEVLFNRYGYADPGTAGDLATDPFMEIVDDGIGMTAEELGTVFIDVASSGTEGLATSLGSFGVGKLAMFSGKRTVATSFTRNPDGTMVGHRIVVEPDFFTDASKMVVEPVPVPDGQGPGTRVRIEFKQSDADFGDARANAEAAAAVADPSSQTRFVVRSRHRAWDGTRYSIQNETLADTQDHTFRTTKGATFEPDPIHEETFPGFRVRLYQSTKRSNAGGGWTDGASVKLFVRNKGAFQFQSRHATTNAAQGYAPEVIVDIESTPGMKAVEDDYPFTLDRESLKGRAERIVNDLVQRHVIDGARQRFADSALAVYNGLTAVRVGDATVHFYDAGQRFTPEEFREMTSNPHLQALGRRLHDLVFDFEAIFKDVNAPGLSFAEQSKIERAGIFFAGGAREGNRYWGVNIRRPQSSGARTSTVLLNPLEDLHSTAALMGDPNFENPATLRIAVRHMVDTALHETGHQKFTGHDKDFQEWMVNAQAYLYSGGETTSNVYLNALTDLTNLLSGNVSARGSFSGQPSLLEPALRPEFAELVARYTAARQRPDTRTDILSQESEYQRTPRDVSREGALHATSRPDAAGAEQPATGHRGRGEGLLDEDGDGGADARDLRDASRPFAEDVGRLLSGIGGAVRAGVGRNWLRAVDLFRAQPDQHRPWRGGPPPVRLDPDPDKDINLLQMLLPPENVVPDYVAKVRRPLAEFEAWVRTHRSATLEEFKAARRKILGPVARALRKQARELRYADEARQPRRATYLMAFADELMGALTTGERNLSRVGVAPALARRTRNLAVAQTYNITTGLGIDTALQNLTQPLLLLAHVPARYIGTATRRALTAEGRTLTEHLKTGRPTDLQEVVEEMPRHATSRAERWYQTYTDLAQFPLAKTDLHNRRVAFLAAHQYALDNGATPGVAYDWAMAVTRKTQGDPSTLGRSPLLRGPFVGLLTPFTKYPLMFTAHMVDTWRQPDNAGRQRMFGAFAGLIALGALMGVDLEDLLVSGGRPLGIDPAHPVRSLKRVMRGDAFPIVRGAKNVGGLMSGEQTPGDLVKAAILPRWPLQTAESIDQLRTYEGPAYPQYDPKTGSLLNDRTAGEMALNAVGLRTTRQTTRREALKDFMDRARSLSTERMAERGRSYAEIGEALDAGDTEEAARIAADGQLGTGGALRQFMRRRNLRPEQRRLQQMPRDLRRSLDEEFGERFRATEIPRARQN